MNTTEFRPVNKVVRGLPLTEGAGVELTRFIGTSSLELVDPFLLLDEFRSDRPEDYLSGFPSHPHRGFETVTYMLEGCMRHRDSKGNEGLLQPGSVQWMTAGRGIIHSEMPEMNQGLLWGLQLWVNLPARLKMAPPRYQEIAAGRIPRIVGDGMTVRVIAGEYGGERGPVSTHINILYLDVSLTPGARFEVAVPPALSAMGVVLEGAVSPHGRGEVNRDSLLLFGDGNTVNLAGAGEGGRLLLIAGEPLGEPVARRGPFVMNTEAELEQAFKDYRNGVLDR